MELEGDGLEESGDGLEGGGDQEECERTLRNGKGRNGTQRYRMGYLSCLLTYHLRHYLMDALSNSQL